MEYKNQKLDKIVCWEIRMEWWEIGFKKYDKMIIVIHRMMNVIIDSSCVY